MERMAAESRKLQGTALARPRRDRIGQERGADDRTPSSRPVAAASAACWPAAWRGRGQAQQRTKTLTTTHESLDCEHGAGRRRRDARRVQGEVIAGAAKGDVLRLDR